MLPRRFRFVAVLAALSLVVAFAFWTVRDHRDSGPGAQSVVGLGRVAPVVLTTGQDCAALLAYYRREADRMVGPYGLGGVPVNEMLTTTESEAGRAGGPVVPDAQAGSAAAAAPTAQPDSSTNVQVAGVDESDVVKTSGDLMVSVQSGAVRVTRLAGAQTKTLATWRPKGNTAQSVLLDGSTAVIVGTSASSLRPVFSPDTVSPAPSLLARPFAPVNQGATDLTVLDLRVPAHPRPVRHLRIEGTLAGDARLVDGELRFAVNAGPSRLNWKEPRYGQGEQSATAQRKAEQAATTANRKIIAGSTIADWIPQATVTSLDAAGQASGSAVRRPLLDCRQVSIPSRFSGLATLALVSVDLRAAPLASWRSAGVIASGTTLYATADHAWLATTQWDVPQSGGSPTSGSASTQIHLFDTPVRAQPQYVASGQVAGTLLNQFAMDEQDGLLRVASTTEPNAVAPVRPVAVTAAGPGPSPTASPSPSPIPTVASAGRISVLQVSPGNGSAVDGKSLVQVGVLTGLGQGEQIRGVRFDGAIGYVVTYRQTDPLYTVDLSDPRHPKLEGELTLPGYSAYLHPDGPGRILGLGQNGTANGQVTGLQLSLFDVSDLSAPRRLAQQKLNGAWSDAEADHHAFTMAGNLVLVPFSSWSTQTKVPGGGSGQRFDAGVIAVRVSAGGLGTPVVLRPIADGPVTGSTWDLGGRLNRVLQATPTRTVVYGGLIYTLTPTGVAVHNGATFERLTFDRF